MLKIAIIIGSTRPGRKGPAVARINMIGRPIDVSEIEALQSILSDTKARRKIL